MSSRYQMREQFRPFHERNQRWSLIVAHRRCGKTVAVINDMLEKAAFNPRKAPRYAYIAPFLKQAKDIAWTYLKEYGEQYGAKANESGLFVELTRLPNNPRITIYGADNPDSFRGIYLDGAALDEFGNMKGSTFQEILLPALIDRRGWGVFMGTPNGPNHFRDIWYQRQDDDTWFKSFLPVSKTKIIPEEELAMMRQMMDPEQYSQEMECSFEASVRGAIYARQIEEMTIAGRISNEWKAQRGLPVNVVADLGWRDHTVLGFFQERPDGIVVDRATGSNLKPVDYYIDEIKAYFRQTNHKMGKIWLPHDAKAKTLQTGKSTMDAFIRAKLPVDLVPELSLQDGITATRTTFPLLYYNEAGTKDLVLAMKSYHRKYDEEKKSYTEEPVHDWSSNWADMQRYMSIVSNRKSSVNKGGPRLVTPVGEGLNYGFALNDIWDTGPRKTLRL